MKIFYRMTFFFLLSQAFLPAQDFIDVTFRHYPSGSSVVRAFVPGTFNNWGPNSNGRIQADAPSLMTYIDSLGYYVKVVPLIAGGSYEYKFHEHYNDSGSQWRWFTDPLNPLMNTYDNNNSILQVNRAMIFQIHPPMNAVVTESQPTLTAGVFTTDNDSILLDRSNITLDGQLLTSFDGYMISSLSLLSYRLPLLANGVHQASLTLVTQSGESVTDSILFTVTAGDVHFITPSTDHVLADYKTIRWYVGLGQTRIRSVILKQIDKYPVSFSGETEREYEFGVTLTHGENKYVVSVTDSAGGVTESDTLRLIYPEPQKPQPEIIFEVDENRLKIKGLANDPQDGEVQYEWSTPVTNVAGLPGVNGSSDEQMLIDIPRLPGDYSVKLMVTDEDGNANSAIQFFTILPDSSVRIPDQNTVPSWVANARLYSMFIRSYTPEGTIQAAAEKLEHIRDMGFNVIWVLPVMDVEGVLDQNYNIGYNILDFYNVEPTYGMNEDFKTFVEKAHGLGLRVILDVTPNHCSRSHPIALDVRRNKKYSRYYDYFQHEFITHNTNGLGQSLSQDGIVYYSGFTDVILNWNWEDDEARQYMIDVYTHWIREYDIDGFRFDVYWGPHRRYGRDHFDVPLRTALRAAKADIMILGETNGTGVGVEIQFGDRGGGMDLGYDWILKDAIHYFPTIALLDNRLYNNGFRPGLNSFVLRFLENHDEYRVAHRYNSIEKTIPVSTAVFLSTGIPMLFQGQEVGMGFGMSGSKEYLARSTVQWNQPWASLLSSHYQKLIQIRAQFPAFRRQMEDLNGDYEIDSNDPSMQPRLLTTSVSVYAYGRPYSDQNGVVVMNFSDQTQQPDVSLNLEAWGEFSEGYQADQTYFVNNLYQNTSSIATGADLSALPVNLAPYEVAVFTISTREDRLELPEITVQVAGENPGVGMTTCRLLPNFPNPFNSRTVIVYQLSTAGFVELSIVNPLGQGVRALVCEKRTAGTHSVVWDGRTDTGEPVSSSVYICRLRSGEHVRTSKILLIR